jgi:hypothetical protein
MSGWVQQEASACIPVAPVRSRSSPVTAIMLTGVSARRVGRRMAVTMMSPGAMASGRAERAGEAGAPAPPRSAWHGRR